MSFRDLTNGRPLSSPSYAVAIVVRLIRTCLTSAALVEFSQTCLSHPRIQHLYDMMRVIKHEAAKPIHHMIYIDA